jgi:methionine synthase II (cobalamin-independent)
MSQPQGALLVGSVNLPDAETTMLAASRVLGDRLRRIPDGEVGDRFHWIAFQPDVLAKTEGLERIGDEPLWLKHLDLRGLRIVDGVTASELRLPPLGYASAALESWKVFDRLQEAGEIPAGTRFQVSLPTPAAVVGAYFRGDDRAAIEPVYAAAIFRELDEILANIPHTSLAIQWDTAVEFAFLELAGYEERYGGAYTPWFDDVWQGVIDRAVTQARAVPLDVEVGFHLCYGDAGEMHFIEPTDAGKLVEFAQRLLDAAPRPIAWIHLPVPIERDDDAYFAPLDALRVTDETEIYLGLVHREDGVEGACRRIAVAEKHLTRFGVATECGCGRAPEDQTVPLLQTHREVATAW